MNCILVFLLIVSFLYTSIIEGATESNANFAHTIRNIGSQKCIVLIISRLGLANRLRAISDWYHAAKISNRVLIVSWESTEDCNAEFFELFEDAPSDVIFLHQHLPAEPEGMNVAARTANALDMSYLIVTDSNGEHDMIIDGHDRFVMKRNMLVNDFQAIITDYNGVFILDGTTCADYLQMHSAFLLSLVPVPLVAQLLDRLHTEHFENKVMVGIHYRDHDTTHDWAVVPPLMGSSTDRIFGEGATIFHFVDAMRRIENSHIVTDTEGNSATNVRFFIASNSVKAKHTLLTYFPTAVYLDGVQSRGSLEGIHLALTEWLALTRSALILHTYGSTFAEHAAHMHLTPVVGIWEGMLVTHSSVSLPFCGNLNFATAYSKNQGIKGTFKADATSEVETVYLPLQYTNSLHMWGLSEVLCSGAIP